MVGGGYECWTLCRFQSNCPRARQRVSDCCADAAQCAVLYLLTVSNALSTLCLGAMIHFRKTLSERISHHWCMSVVSVHSSQWDFWWKERGLDDTLEQAGGDRWPQSFKGVRSFILKAPMECFLNLLNAVFCFFKAGFSVWTFKKIVSKSLYYSIQMS